MLHDDSMTFELEQMELHSLHFASVRDHMQEHKGNRQKGSKGKVPECPETLKQEAP